MWEIKFDKLNKVVFSDVCVWDIVKISFDG